MHEFVPLFRQNFDQNALSGYNAATKALHSSNACILATEIAAVIQALAARRPENAISRRFFNGELRLNCK